MIKIVHSSQTLNILLPLFPLWGFSDSFQILWKQTQSKGSECRFPGEISWEQHSLGVKEAGAGRGRSWAARRSRQRPQPPHGAVRQGGCCKWPHMSPGNKGTRQTHHLQPTLLVARRGEPGIQEGPGWCTASMDYLSSSTHLLFSSRPLSPSPLI